LAFPKRISSATSFQPPSARPGGATFAAAALLYLAGLPQFTAAQEDRLVGWNRFENTSFVAYSDAAESDVLEVLEELELVRAAVAQTPSLALPEGRPKTVAVMPGTRPAFLDFTPYETVAGFALQIDDSAAIVMPVDSGRDSAPVVRHEFGHTLLFNPWFVYPTWYAEGFAEVISTIAVDRKRLEFVIGRRPGRYNRHIRDAIGWDLLLDARFDAHTLEDEALIRAAYSQNWALVHFLTLGGQAEHRFQVERYFGAVNSGTPSPEAFRAAFETTPADLWAGGLERYVRKPPTRKVRFDPVLLDLDFVVTPAAADELGPLLRYLRDRASAARATGAPPLPLALLAGRWDQLKYGGQCTEPFEFAHDAGRGLLRIEGFYSAAGAEPVPALFSPQQSAPNVYALTNVTAADYPQVHAAADYQVTMKSESVACFDRRPFERACSSVLHRCPD